MHKTIKKCRGKLEETKKERIKFIKRLGEEEIIKDAVEQDWQKLREFDLIIFGMEAVLGIAGGKKRAFRSVERCLKEFKKIVKNSGEFVERLNKDMDNICDYDFKMIIFGMKKALGLTEQESEEICRQIQI